MHVLKSLILFCLFPIFSNCQVIKRIHYSNGGIIGVCGAMIDDQTFFVRGETSNNKTVISKFNLDGDSIWTSIVSGGIIDNTYGTKADKQMAVTHDKGCVFTH